MHQIPIGFLAIAGFLVGLVATFWVAGLFGFPAPLFWAAIVTAFILGVFLLQKPKVFLVFAFVYYYTFLNGMLFGTIRVPIPFARLLDEFILAVPLAYLVMRSINRSLPRQATWFPFFYLVIALVSYKANDVPTLNWVRAVLSLSKFYIYWYFARALGPWSLAEKKRWFWGVFLFALAQFVMNVIWQRNIVVTIHPDYSVGTMGNAHLVGYVSAGAIFYTLAWFLTAGKTASRASRWGVLCGVVLISYNFIFLTDTKHALVTLPIVGLPFLLHRGIPMRYRMAVVLAAMVFLVFSGWYIVYGPYTMQASVADYFKILRWSGKGYLYRTILTQIPRENPTAFFIGVGPGNFCSTAGVYGFRPLAVKYVLPFIVQGLRSGGASAEASVLGSPTASFLVLLGEFGWVGTIIYYAFWIWVAKRFFGLSQRSVRLDWDTGQRLALVCNIAFVLVQSFLTDLMGYGQIVLPMWTLAAMYWDVSTDGASGGEAPLLSVQVPRQCPLLSNNMKLPR